MNYIKLTQDQVIELNEILYAALVSDDGCHTFKFPFKSGTSSYIDVARHDLAYPVDERILQVAQDNTRVATLVSGAVTRAEALANGWLQEAV